MDNQMSVRWPLRSARQAGGLKVDSHRENKGRCLLGGLGDWGALIEEEVVLGVLGWARAIKSLPSEWEWKLNQ